MPNNLCTLRSGANQIPFEIDGGETVRDAFETARECFNLDPTKEYSVMVGNREATMDTPLTAGAVVEFAIKQGRKADF